MASKTPATSSLASYHAWISAKVLILARFASTRRLPEGRFQVVRDHRHRHVGLADGPKECKGVY